MLFNLYSLVTSGSDLLDQVTGNDWGAAEWSEDTSAAQAYAASLVEQVASAKEWSSAWVSAGSAMVENAADQANTAIEFWTVLAETWSLYDSNGPDGWSKLTGVWKQASGASTTTAESRDMADLSEQLEAAYDQTVTDLTDPTQSWIPWAIGAALVGGVVLFVKTR